MNVMTRGGGLLLAGATAAVALVAPKPVHSADHRDATSLTATATPPGDPATDINDVFTFVDGGKFVLMMTVFPFATSAAKFSSTAKYVFHTQSGTKFGEYKKSEDIVCTFSADATQKVSCWAGTDDYVTGDASTSITSASGKLKVHTGYHADPFFFNLQGFKDTVSAVEAAAASLMPFDGSGCPTKVDATTAGVLGGLLKEKTSASSGSTKTAEDDFPTANTLAIVISGDLTLFNAGGDYVSVWASTNK